MTSDQLPDIPQQRMEERVDEAILNTSENLEQMVDLMRRQLRQRMPVAPKPQVVAQPQQPVTPPPEQPKQEERSEPKKETKGVGFGEAIVREAADETSGFIKGLLPSISDIVDSATTNSPGMRLAVSMIKGVSGFISKANERVEKIDEPKEQPAPVVNVPEIEVPPVEVDVPEQPAPVVNVPEMQPPTVEVPELEQPEIVVQPASVEMPEIELPDGVDPYLNSLAEDLVGISRVQTNLLERMLTVWDDDFAQATKMRDAHLEALRMNNELERRRIEADELERLNAMEDDREQQQQEAELPSPDFQKQAEELEKQSGFADMLLGGLAGAMGGLAAMIVPALGKLKKVGKLLRVGPLALATVVWEFGNGFFDAEKVLGKASVDLYERTQAGLIELAGGFGDLVDMIMGFVGVDSDIGRVFRDGVMDITTPIVDFFQMATTYIRNTFSEGWQERIGDKLESVKESVVDSISTAITASSEAVSDFFRQIWDGVLDELISMVDTVNFGGMADDVITKLENAKSSKQLPPDTQVDTTDEDKRRSTTEKIKEERERIRRENLKLPTTQAETESSAVFQSNVNHKSVTNNTLTQTDISVHDKRTYNYQRLDKLRG